MLTQWSKTSLFVLVKKWPKQTSRLASPSAARCFAVRQELAFASLETLSFPVSSSATILGRGLVKVHVSNSYPSLQCTIEEKENEDRLLKLRRAKNILDQARKRCKFLCFLLLFLHRLCRFTSFLYAVCENRAECITFMQPGGFQRFFVCAPLLLCPWPNHL